MLEWVAGVLALIALAPYVIGPVLIRFAQAFPARPALEPYDAARHALDDDLEAGLRRSVEALEAEGLTPFADLSHDNPLAKAVMHVVTLEHRETGGYVAAVAAQSTDPRANIRLTYVEAVARFTDGRTLSVHNNPQPDVFGPHPGRLVERLPAVRDPARLWRVFRELLRRRYGSIARARRDPAADPVAYVALAMAREMERHVETGYLAPHRDPGLLRPSWWGAWAMTWRLLPPMRQIREWRGRRRAAALLDELGLGGPDARPVPTPPLRDPLRWNVVGLLVALLLFWLARSGGGFSPSRREETVTPPLGFAVPGDWQGAVGALERAAGGTAGPLTGTDTLGRSVTLDGVTVPVPASRSASFVGVYQPFFLEQGFYLFVLERHFDIDGRPDVIGLSVGSDPYALLEGVGTNAWNYGFGPDSIVRWLRALEREQPFRLTGIAFDWLEARFTSALRDPAGLAARVYAFCPDVVDQGTGTVRRLARELRTTGTLYCWWD